MYKALFPADPPILPWLAGGGRCLHLFTVEVLASVGPTGPATLVRVISHPGMSRAVELMVERLKLSGLCGFDFILNAEDGTAQLLELNPRATQTSYLIAADGKDLLAHLHSVLQKSLVALEGLRSASPSHCFLARLLAGLAGIGNPGHSFEVAGVGQISAEERHVARLGRVRQRPLDVTE